jgi:zinc/manganese transport system ATP-binding protein
VVRHLLGVVVNGAPDAAVILDDVTLAYDGWTAVRQLNGAFDRGSMTAIVGPNGAGKTTLLKGMAGLLRPAAGVIRRSSPRNGGIAYLPQHAEIDRRFPISVIQTVLLGHWRRIGWAHPATRDLRRRAEEALSAVGLQGLERKAVETLSAGQFQRVLFARVMVQDAALILLDEPFAAVDWRTSEDLLGVIATWHREGRTVAAVLHDLDQVRAWFPETLLLARRCVAWGATREALTAENMRRALRLCDEWPEQIEHSHCGPRARSAGASGIDLLFAPSWTRSPRGEG